MKQLAGLTYITYRGNINSMYGMDANVRELTRVCYLHYRRGLTQTEIAKQLGKSNMSVSRLLREARDRGIVQFQLTVPCPSDSKVASRLKAEFDSLDEVIAVENDLLGANDIKKALGQVATGYLPFFLRSGINLGVGGGDTIAHLVDSLHDVDALTDITVVQLAGVTGQVTRLGNEARTTQRLSEKLDARGFFCPLPSPLDQHSLGDRRKLLAEFGGEARQRWSKIDIGLVGIGQIDSRLTPSREGYLSADQLDSLKGANAVGDILLHFFGSEGRIVDPEFDATVTAISWEQLRHAETLIAVAGGQHKAPAILGALRSGLINVLITDRDTASIVLDRLEGEKEGGRIDSSARQE